MVRAFTVRMGDDDVARIKALQQRLQERAEPHFEVTQRITILRALDALEKRLDELDRDKERKR